MRPRADVHGRPGTRTTEPSLLDQAQPLIEAHLKGFWPFTIAWL